MGSVTRCAACAIAVIKADDVRLLFISAAWGGQKFLPVKQGGISDKTHRKKSVFYIQVIPDNEMQKVVKLFFTSLK